MTDNKDSSPNETPLEGNATDSPVTEPQSSIDPTADGTNQAINPTQNGLPINGAPPGADPAPINPPPGANSAPPGTASANQYPYPTSATVSGNLPPSKTNSLKNSWLSMGKAWRGLIIALVLILLVGGGTVTYWAVSSANHRDTNWSQKRSGKDFPRGMPSECVTNEFQDGCPDEFLDECKDEFLDGCKDGYSRGSRPDASNPNKTPRHAKTPIPSSSTSPSADPGSTSESTPSPSPTPSR